MSGIVQLLRPEPAPDTILAGAAISSGREWFQMGHLANWLNGAAAQHVPGIIVDKTVPAAGTRTLRFRTNARYNAIERRWTFMLRSTTAGASCTINTGGGAVTYSINSGRDTRLPIEHRDVLSAQAAGVTELTCTIVSVTGAIEIDSVTCCDMPRGLLLQSASENGVDTNTLRPRERIFSSLTTGESATGVLASSLADIRRVGLYQWAVPSEDPVTRTGAYTDLLTLPVPLLAPLLDQAQASSEKGAVYWSVYAKVDAGSGDVSLSASQSGGSDSVNITGTSFAWTTPRTINVSCEDMTTADGRRGAAYDDLTIQIRGTGGTLSLASVSVWNEAI